jgi:hypothetical protein
MVLSEIEASTIKWGLSQKIELSLRFPILKKAPSDKRFYDGALIGNFNQKMIQATFHQP